MQAYPTHSLSSLAGHLVNDGLLDENLAKLAWQQAKTHNLSFASYLVKNKLLSSREILECCFHHFGLPIFDLSEYKPEPDHLKILNDELVRRYRIIPIAKHGKNLTVGLIDPSDHASLDAIRFHTGLSLSMVLIEETKLNDFIDEHYNSVKNKNLQLKVLASITPDDSQVLEQENNTNSEEPLIQFVDHLICHAKQQAASDIHIEAYEKSCRIRYRQDGILYEIAELPQHLSSRVSTRLKVMANLDITERRLPQDGRLQLYSHQHELIDARLSCCPMLYGEKLVLRLLDSSKLALPIHSLGFTSEQETLLLEKIAQPQGLILVTGPTGSGKTVTLYSALQYLNTREKNILTIEDPVEIQLEGINQVPVNPKIGLDFATALRAFLRQDPDIIMVGEIRDKETAQIALQASQTGHLVLATLHTNNALETLSRLIAMGSKPYQLAETIALIIAQRLLRKLCSYCKKQVELSSYSAFGCSRCRDGYQGRVGIFECLPMTENLARLILENKNRTGLIAATNIEGFMTLRQSGFEKIKQGESTLLELQRALQL